MSNQANNDNDLESIIGSVKTKNGIKNLNFENDFNAVDVESDKTFKYLSTLNNDKHETLTSSDNNSKTENCDNPIILRDLISYYLLGLCNNFGFFVMLSAANDIMKEFHEQQENTITDVNTRRICYLLSTGTILLADVIPGLIIKCIVPFMPFYVNVRVVLAISVATAGYLIIGFSTTKFYTISGIVMISASACLGESTLLSYSANYNKNVVAAWSAGGAGIVGSLTYAALRAFNVSQRSTILLMLIIPIIECLIFWILLRHPKNIKQSCNSNDNKDNSIIEKNTESVCDEKPLITLLDKIQYLGFLLKYMIPLMTIYFAQYFINQGLFQLVYFENIFLDKASQYRWLIVDYQIGVFIARSTVCLFTIKPIWIMSLLQLLNIVYFLMEAIFYITPNIWITFLIVFWEGLLGGGGYAYTFYNISKEVSKERKRIAMGIVSISDTIGITVAGCAAISVHNAICSLPAPVRY